MASNYITFNKVRFSYQKQTTPVLDNCSFHLNTSERLALKGKSGAGKTTIFRLILGFEQPDDGKILFRGKPLDTAAIKQLRRETVWLPQDLNLGNGTLHEIFYFPFEFEANAAHKPDADTIFSVMQSLGLKQELWETSFADLSTGQRQRAGIALCYLMNKPLMVLDEPTSALDEYSKQRVANLLFEDVERTIISTSHDPWWIERCDKIVELN